MEYVYYPVYFMCVTFLFYIPSYCGWDVDRCLFSVSLFYVLSLLMRCKINECQLNSTQYSYNSVVFGNTADLFYTRSLKTSQCHRKHGHLDFFLSFQKWVLSQENICAWEAKLAHFRSARHRIKTNVSMFWGCFVPYIYIDFTWVSVAFMLQVLCSLVANKNKCNVICNL